MTRKDDGVTAGISILIPKGKLGTPQTVLSDLSKRVSTMTEIYVVITDKDGTSQEYISGDLAGLTFAILMLQNYALNSL